MADRTIEDPAAERRNGERVNRIFAVRHRLVRRPGSRSISDWSLSSTRNMSHSGLLFLSATSYRRGDVLELQVVMSGVIDVYNGRAEVMRVKEISAAAFDVGVKYIPAKLSTRSAKSHLGRPIG